MHRAYGGYGYGVWRPESLRLRILPNHHENIGDGTFVQQELTRHSPYLRRGVECEAVHTCHPIKPDSQSTLAGGGL